MYDALGSKELQKKIRDKNADKHHCNFLKRKPDACEVFPEAVGGSKVGRPCPNNPYELYAPLWGDLNEANRLLNHAHYLGSLVELGQLPGQSELSPEDFTVAVLMRQRSKAHEIEAMSLGAIQAGFAGGGREE